MNSNIAKVIHEPQPGGGGGGIVNHFLCTLQEQKGYYNTAKHISVAAVSEGRRLASYPGSPYEPGWKGYQETNVVGMIRASISNFTAIRVSHALVWMHARLAFTRAPVT